MMDQKDNRSEYKDLANALKQILKSRRITYSQLAKLLGVSEPSIKRLFTRDDGSVVKLSRICDLLGFSFKDLVNWAYEGPRPYSLLTETQEDFFSNHLSHFYFFRELVSRKKCVQEIQKAFDLPISAVWQYLKDLENIKILEIHPKNRIRLLVQEPITFQKGSPLRKKLFHQYIVDFSDQLKQQGDGIVKEWMLSSANCEEFHAKLRVLSEEFDQRSAHDWRMLSKEELVSVSILLGVIQGDWQNNLRHKIGTSETPKKSIFP